jgi:hypothetical protein
MPNVVHNVPSRKSPLVPSRLGDAVHQHRLDDRAMVVLATAQSTTMFCRPDRRRELLSVSSFFGYFAAAQRARVQILFITGNRAQGASLGNPSTPAAAPL